MSYITQQKASMPNKINISDQVALSKKIDICIEGHYRLDRSKQVIEQSEWLSQHPNQALSRREKR